MVRKHPCPECGANLEWNAQAQALKCPYCGTTVPWSEETREELGRDVVEQDLAEALRNPKSGRAGVRRTATRSSARTAVPSRSS